MTLAIGTQVTVSARAHAGHHRTPRYLKGRSGTIVAIHARYRNPEGLAYHEDGMPKRLLVRVAFEPTSLFTDYRGRPGDVIEADLFEHWLEVA
jgi:nitrile hydratase subunit beta